MLKHDTMAVDHRGLEEALERALERLFAHDGALVDAGAGLVTIAHRLALYLENELKASLLLSELAVDLDHVAGSDIRGPSIAVQYRPAAGSGESPQRILALECRRNLLGPADKRRLLGLEGHPGTFERALGIAWKPGASYFLLYHLREGGVALKRIRKQKVRFKLRP